MHVGRSHGRVPRSVRGAILALGTHRAGSVGPIEPVPRRSARPTNGERERCVSGHVGSKSTQELPQWFALVPRHPEGPRRATQHRNVTATRIVEVSEEADAVRHEQRTEREVGGERHGGIGLFARRQRPEREAEFAGRFGIVGDLLLRPLHTFGAPGLVARLHPCGEAPEQRMSLVRWARLVGELGSAADDSAIDRAQCRNEVGAEGDGHDNRRTVDIGKQAGAALRQ